MNTKTFLKLGIGTLSIMALAAGIAYAQGADMRMMHTMHAPSFEDMDANHDGFIVKSELTGPMSEHFDMMDKNHDGKLDKDEMGKVKIRIEKRCISHEGPMGKHHDEMMAQGKVSRVDFSAHMLKMFDEMDANHDGFLTTDEHGKNKGPGDCDEGQGEHRMGGHEMGGHDMAKMNPAEHFIKMDANHDGYLVKSEIKGKMLDHFDMIDTNHDAKLTQAELKIHHEAMMAKHASH